MSPLAAAVRLHVGGHEVTVTHPDRLLWPQEGITKAELIDYYLRVAPWMLPHLAGRPLVLTRYPDGVEGEGFYQKDRPPGTPDWVPTAPLAAQEGRTIHYLVADRPATLVWLGNLAAIELHPWLSTARHPDRPDLVVVDLDPDPPSTFEEVRQVAFLVREALARLGLWGVPKLSGASGVHVYIPVEPRYTYRQTSRLVALLGRALAQVRPQLVTAERRVRLRAGRVYVDPYQNLRGKTVAGPYSPRPLPGAPVAVPVTWEELRVVNPSDFTLRTADRWLAGRTDPLRQAMAQPQRLDALLPLLDLRGP